MMVDNRYGYVSTALDKRSVVRYASNMDAKLRIDRNAKRHTQ